jgi:bifunctional N-acetylglucosamine-1-phosphate-uridyltransferase/glucosamine-1-phosphate-acetyltransferase GlmU-like protein
MAIGYNESKKTGVMVATDYRQILGVNSCQDLKAVDKIMKKRIRNIS